MNQYTQQLPQAGMNAMNQNYNTAQTVNTQTFTNTITNSIVWVEMEDEAKTWMVGPNNRVFIFVKDNEVLYIKEKNSDGRPLKTEIYDLTKRQTIEEGTNVDLSQYIKKEDVSHMIDDAVTKALERQEEQMRNKYKRYNTQNRRTYHRSNGGMSDEQ